MSVNTIFKTTTLLEVATEALLLTKKTQARIG